MFSNIRGDVIVRMVISVSKVQDDWYPNGAACFHQVFRQQLLFHVKFVSGTLEWDIQKLIPTQSNGVLCMSISLINYTSPPGYCMRIGLPPLIFKYE